MNIHGTVGNLPIYGIARAPGTQIPQEKKPATDLVEVINKLREIKDLLKQTVAKMDEIL